MVDSTRMGIRHHVASFCLWDKGSDSSRCCGQDGCLCQFCHYGTHVSPLYRQSMEYSVSHIMTWSCISHLLSLTNSYLLLVCIRNNVDRRLGFSVPVLYGLALTKVLAAYCFYLVDPLLGKCLLLTLTWLGAAAALETHTWRINPDPDTGKPEPLYPAKGKWKTRFRWETSSSSS